MISQGKVVIKGKYTVKSVLSGHSKIDNAKILMTNGSLMKVESIAECSPWSILQYFWPALNDNRSWKPILVFFLRQVLLYVLNGVVQLVFLGFGTKNTTVDPGIFELTTK